MPKLGVNIDHIATLRQQRTDSSLNLIEAAQLCEANGADSIVVHLREDRRHIQDEDVFLLRKKISRKLNLEMSIDSDIVRLACKLKPDQATLVPERRKELTTEGGLDAVRMKSRLSRVVELLQKQGVVVSLFIEPDKKQIMAAYDIGASIVELHTGRYSNLFGTKKVACELSRIKDSVQYASSLSLIVDAGHGLDYNNVMHIAVMPKIFELNIGYSIVCRAAFVGLGAAVREMKRLVQ